MTNAHFQDRATSRSQCSVGTLLDNHISTTLCQVWYGVPAHASEALEEAMADALPHLFDAAPNLIYQLVRASHANHDQS